MQNQNAQAWTLPPAGERPEFGATVIPDRPGYLMPSPVALHQAFHGAPFELEHRRGREPRKSGYAARSQEAVFEAGMRALGGSLGAIYQEVRKDDPDAIALPREAIPQMQVVASGPGSGKSTSAKAR
jgi:hypothetical protein